MINYIDMYAIWCILWATFAGIIHDKLYGKSGGKHALLAIAVNYLLCPICMAFAAYDVIFKRKFK